MHPAYAPQGEDEGETIIPAEKFLADRDGEKPLGVFAIYDAKNNVQYISYSRNVVLSVRVGTWAGAAGAGRPACSMQGRMHGRRFMPMQHAPCM